jgi:Fic family protein
MLFRQPELESVEIDVLGQIGELKKALRYRTYEPRRWDGSLRRLLFARAIQGSNTIEGYTVAIDDAAAIADREEPLDASAETRLALQGYRDAMTYVIQIAQDPYFHYDAQLFKGMQFMMTGYDLSKSPGRWRPGAVYVRNDETGEIVYEGAPVEDVPGLMDELVDDLEGSSSVDPTIAGAMAHLNLALVHPFRDGNGRMARGLQSLVLAREGELAPVFMSIEEYLGHNTDAYYAVLGEVGASSWDPERDARPWILFCLTAHLRQANTMVRRIAETEQLWDQLERIIERDAIPYRTIYALYDATMGWRIRRATYQSILDNMGEPISDQVATRDLRLLVEAELLVPHGEKRGRYYVGGAPLYDARHALTKSRPRDDADPFASAS